MEIADLQVRQANVNIVVEVVEKGDVREFEKFGKKGSVCNAKVKDETGEISLTLWNEDIDKVKVGDKVQIKNGYVNEYQGEKQLTTGKFGSLEVIGKEDKGEKIQSLQVKEKITKMRKKKDKWVAEKKVKDEKKEEELEEIGKELQELEKEEEEIETRKKQSSFVSQKPSVSVKKEEREEEKKQPEEVEDIAEEEAVEGNNKK